MSKMIKLKSPFTMCSTNTYYNRITEIVWFTDVVVCCVMYIRILNCLNQMSVRSHLIVKLMSYLGHKNWQICP